MDPNCNNIGPYSTRVSYLVGWALVPKFPNFILALSLVGLLSTSFPFLSLPSYWLARDLKSPIFILAFLLVGLLSTRLPFSSLSPYWSASCPQVSHFHLCLLIGQALVH